MKYKILKEINENYGITKDGRLFNIKKGKEVKPVHCNNRYNFTLCVVSTGERKKFNASRLVYAYWHKKEIKFPFFNKKDSFNIYDSSSIIVHKDGNPNNINIKNLEVISKSKWMKKRLALDAQKKNPILLKRKAVPDEDLSEVYFSNKTLRELASDYNCSTMAIHRAKKRYKELKRI